MTIKEISSVGNILVSAKDRYPDKIAITDAVYELTYEELYIKSIIFSSYLFDNHSISSNSVVGFLAQNSVEFVLIHFAIQFSGAVSVPLDPDIKFSYLNQCAKIANIDVVIVKNIETFKQNKEAIQNEPIFKFVDFEYITELLETPMVACVKRLSALSKHRIKVNETAAYMFTTGSTGIPKGVILKQSNVIQALSNIIEFIGYSNDDSELITLPLSHNFGLGHLYCNLVVGGTSYLSDGITNFNLLFELLRKNKPTGFPGTPSGFNFLTKMFPKKLSECKSFLKFIVINSEKCPPSLVKKLTSLLPDTEIIIYYGLTEASRSTFIKFDRDTEDYYLDSSGKSSPNVDIKIVNEDFSNAENNHEGRVAIKGNHLAEGYLGEDIVFNKHNDYLVTDDIGYLDNDDYLFLTGRVSTFINKGGLKIDPKEVEAIIRDIDIIKDVAVIGIDDEISGEKICVCYVSDMFREKVEEFIIQACSTKLEKLKIPDVFVCVDYIPRNKTGKLLQQELRKKVSF